jgi:hypothetical protein
MTPYKHFIAKDMQEIVNIIFYESTKQYINKLKLFLNGRIPFKYLYMEIIERYCKYAPHEIMKLIDF